MSSEPSTSKKRFRSQQTTVGPGVELNSINPHICTPDVLVRQCGVPMYLCTASMTMCRWGPSSTESWLITRVDVCLYSRKCQLSPPYGGMVGSDVTPYQVDFTMSDICSAPDSLVCRVGIASGLHHDMTCIQKGTIENSCLIHTHMRPHLRHVNTQPCL